MCGKCGFLKSVVLAPQISKYTNIINNIDLYTKKIKHRMFRLKLRFAVLIG